MKNQMKNRPPYSYRSDPAVPPFADDKPVILFDGICVLCSGWVQFVLRHDRAGRYRLLAAQSPLGQAILAHYGLDLVDFESTILIKQGRAWFKSEAPIRMAIGLGFPWNLAALARLLPMPLRDWLYEAVARNRYNWFGRRDSCFMPREEYRERFLK
jgi:predicted DCC family thiol-disulfide oxidoreductase YuxK